MLADVFMTKGTMHSRNNKNRYKLQCSNAQWISKKLYCTE